MSLAQIHAYIALGSGNQMEVQSARPEGNVLTVEIVENMHVLLHLAADYDRLFPWLCP